VVELKGTEDTPDKAVGQIARYIGWVQENVGKDKKVEGILVARSASEELKYATKALKQCKLFTYEIQFKFSKM
jgi:RecB family endonuclease NucS